MIERKLICGKPYKRVPCQKCGALIWTAAANQWSCCLVCYPKDGGISSSCGNAHESTPRSDRQYQGEDVR